MAGPGFMPDKGMLGLAPEGTAPHGVEVQGRPRILAAMADAAAGASLVALLGERYNVRLVDGGDAALAARAWDPDLIVADAPLPAPPGSSDDGQGRRAVPVMLLASRPAMDPQAGGRQPAEPALGAEMPARVEAALQAARRPRPAEPSHRGSTPLERTIAAACMVAWVWDPAADALTCSGDVEAVYGISRLETAAQLFALIHPDDAARYGRAWQRAVAMAEGYRSEFRVLRPGDGATVWLEERGMALADPAGAVYALAGVVLEITERKRAEERLSLLAQVTAAVAEAPDEAAAMLRVASLLVPLLADRCAMGSTGADGRIIWLAAAGEGPPDQQALAALWEDLGTADEPRLIPWLGQDPPPAAGVARGSQAADGSRALSVLLVPLIAGGRAQGALVCVAAGSRRRYGPDELALAREVARRVALAVETARLQRERQAAALRATRLQAVTVALSGALTPEAVAEVVVADGLSAVEADAGSVFYYDQEAKVFDLLGFVGYEIEVAPQHTQVPAERAGPLAEAVATGGLVAVESPAALVARWPHLAEDQARSGDAATVTAPLLANGQVLGVLHAAFRQPRAFSPEDRTFLITLARQCAQALERARLYQAESRARAAAEAERRHLQQILDVLPEGILIADAAPTYLMENRAAREILGQALAGRPMPVGLEEAYRLYGARYLDGTPLPTEDLPLLRALRRGEVVLGARFRIRRATDGRQIPLLLNAAPLRDATGATAGAVMAFQDISPILELEHARDAFLASAAHDLKTPLTSIRGLTQLAQRRLARTANPELERVVESLAGISEATKQMVRLIDELLDVARIQMGVLLDLECHRTDLVALVRAVAGQQAGVTSNHILVQSSEASLEGYVDPARVARVVANLLSNAVKYSPDGGEIVVRLERRDGAAGPCALIAVQDQGIGIPEADQPYIFERFRRGGNVTGHIQGTGIGLASARQIVERHGGSIAVQSTEGRGSTFTVLLPLGGEQGPRD